MKLTNVRIKKFRNIIDSTEVKINDEVTCLVGKNESGKTAFLHALYRLNPALPNVNFSVQRQYPAWKEKKDRLNGKNLKSVKPVVGIFELEETDEKFFKDSYGYNPLQDKIIEVSRNYEGELFIDFEINEEKIVENELKNVTEKVAATEEDFNIKTISNFNEIEKKLKDLENRENDNAQELYNALNNSIPSENDFINSLEEDIGNLLPQFFYYDEYSSLPGEVKIQRLFNTNPQSLSNSEHAALSLLRIAAVDEDSILDSNYESRKRELENMANAITDEVLEYWSQNQELRVETDITKRVEGSGNNRKTVLDELKIRLYDQRHMLSLPFDERSSGFRWFFSFIAAFSEYRLKDKQVIILLDEPALGLHARAQSDFLSYIDENLASKHQVLYTTHSPFMIQTDNLDRIRLVEEKEKEVGSKISGKVMSTDTDTLFPLQGALGYDMAQNLFVSPCNLVVEGTSDFTYLNIMSDFLEEKEKTFLDSRWTIVPVGGADMIPTFVSLLGNHLDVTVLVDAQKGGNQKLSYLASKGYLAQKRIITIGEIVNSDNADIEDLFEPEDYLLIYNKTFDSNISQEELRGDDSIVSQIARYNDEDYFNHGKPADLFLKKRDEILPKLSDKTINNFEELFDRINQTLQ